MFQAVITTRYLFSGTDKLETNAWVVCIIDSSVDDVFYVFIKFAVICVMCVMRTN